MIKRIAIIDDDRDTAAMIQKKAAEQDWGCIVETEVFCNPHHFLDMLEDGKRYDLCFSDVIMPGMNGIRLAEEIRKRDPALILVFISSYPQYAIQGYRVVAYDYILKDQFERKWKDLADRLKKDMKKTDEEIYLIETPNRFEKIRLNEILYIYKDVRNAIFVLEDRTVSVRRSLRQIQEELAGSQQFVLVERGYIANLEKIRNVIQKEIEMDNGDRIPIGRLRVQTVRDKIHEYWGSRFEEI